jgi:hypothetical protein
MGIGVGGIVAPGASGFVVDNGAGDGVAVAIGAGVGVGPVAGAVGPGAVPPPPPEHALNAQISSIARATSGAALAEPSFRFETFTAIRILQRRVMR